MAELMIFNTVEVNGEPWLAGKDVAQAPAHYVRRVPLPLSVYGVTLLNNDGSFDIYLNSRHPKQKQDETLTHELNHIQQDHFYKMCIRDRALAPHPLRRLSRSAARFPAGSGCYAK